MPPHISYFSPPFRRCHFAAAIIYAPPLLLIHAFIICAFTICYYAAAEDASSLLLLIARYATPVYAAADIAAFRHAADDYVAHVFDTLDYYLMLQLPICRLSVFITLHRACRSC